MEFSTAEKHSLIANLIKLAQADGQMNPREIMFIQTIALQQQVSPADFQSIISRADYLAGSAPSSDEARLKVLYIVLTGMNIDQNADATEVEFCRRLGTNMYLPDEKVSKAINFMINNTATVVSEDAFLASLN